MTDASDRKLYSLLTPQGSHNRHEHENRTSVERRNLQSRRSTHSSPKNRFSCVQPQLSGHRVTMLSGIYSKPNQEDSGWSANQTALIRAANPTYDRRLFARPYVPLWAGG
jgi:hypothetical protein